jgi:hypothetical protein
MKRKINFSNFNLNPCSIKKISLPLKINNNIKAFISSIDDKCYFYQVKISL